MRKRYMIYLQSGRDLHYSTCEKDCACLTQIPLLVIPFPWVVVSLMCLTLLDKDYVLQTLGNGVWASTYLK